MQVTIDIPDEFAALLIPADADPTRVVLEDYLVEAYRRGRISTYQLQRLLGIESRYELDGYLKARRVWIEYTPEQMAEDEKFQQEFVANHAKKPA